MLLSIFLKKSCSECVETSFSTLDNYIFLLMNDSHSSKYVTNILKWLLSIKYV